jgi:hypothetical protein
MTRSRLNSLAFLVAMTFTAAALAQQPPAPALGIGGSGSSSGGPPPGYPSPAAPGESSPEGSTWPVVMVTSVEVLRSERSGGMDILRARGLVTSSAWTGPRLVPITQGKPIDGVLDVLFVAAAPAAPAAPGELMAVEALLPLGHGHPYKAVRVRSGTNAVAAKSIPGFAEVKVPKHDCGKCIGRFFVAKGESPPAGAGPNDIVKQENLPWDLRIIKPTDGIAGYSINPNRLTLVLGEDGRIVDAAWD